MRQCSAKGTTFCTRFALKLSNRKISLTNFEEFDEDDVAVPLQLLKLSISIKLLITTKIIAYGTTKVWRLANDLKQLNNSF